MLGHWSFDQYFKKEAIIWGWKLLTQEYGLPPNRLFATVHKDDDQSYQIWCNDTDIDKSHILRFTKDNFWEMAASGPCGYCSEIHFDRGPLSTQDITYQHKTLGINQNNNRYIELINFVFIDKNKSLDGSLSELGTNNVDTGAGLERLALLIQSSGSNYHTDLFKPIIDKIVLLSGVSYDQGVQGNPHRVISDHIRALSFALADGVNFSRGGQGYVLRRILRRALRYSTKLTNQNKPFVYQLVDSVCAIMQDHYPELQKSNSRITKLIIDEEQKFIDTLGAGITIINNLIDDAHKKNLKVLDGKKIFKLYDTYGFPLDLSKEIASEHQLTIDQQGYNQEMTKQRTLARNSQKFSIDSDQSCSWIRIHPGSTTEFCGYHHLNFIAKTLKYRFLSSEEIHNQLKNTKYPEHFRSIKHDLNKPRSQIMLIECQLNSTGFYPRSGGQEGDVGYLINDFIKLEVLNTYYIFSHITHRCQLISGDSDHPQAFDQFSGIVDKHYRLQSSIHHSCTHLLNSALRKYLGDHVTQQGAYSNNNSLRFDFSHPKPLSSFQLKQIEFAINNTISNNYPIKIDHLELKTALQQGAVFLTSENYDHHKVRVVTMESTAKDQDDNFHHLNSKELCGGTHVNSTGQIGYFIIMSEGSIASGIRRITAKAGIAAVSAGHQIRSEWTQIYSLLKLPIKLSSTAPSQNNDDQYDGTKSSDYLAHQQLKTLIEKNIDLSSQIDHLHNIQLSSYVHLLIDKLEHCKKPQTTDHRFLVTELSDQFNKKDLGIILAKISTACSEDNAIIVIYHLESVHQKPSSNNKNTYDVMIICSVSKTLQPLWHAGKLIKFICNKWKGDGGGRPDRAQGGIKSIDHDTVKNLRDQINNFVFSNQPPYQ